MVRDGILYAAGFAVAAVAIALVQPWLSLPLWLLAAFCLYFFRDPDRDIPDGLVAVSPADGKVVAVCTDGPSQRRVSIFLNIFDVHVNRTPIPGKVTCVNYTKGKFLAANKAEASDANEQSILTVEGLVGGVHTTVMFKQIAGLIARRIICYKKAGDILEAGERVGLIKFGSRVDVFLGPEWELMVRAGDRVTAGLSVIARIRESAESI